VTSWRSGQGSSSGLQDTADAGDTIAPLAPRGFDLAQARQIMPVYDHAKPAEFRAADQVPCGFSPAMTNVQTTKLIGYAWSDLFNLVLDVKSYPEFVPHCREVRLLSRNTKEPGMTIIVSRMTVGFSAFQVSYANRTTADATGRKIFIEALSGPLRYLSAIWSFEPRDEDHTWVHFSVDYEFSNPVLAVVASRVFAAMFGEILNAFERRAVRLFRDKPPQAPRPGAERG
jgi:coenzyme Q-binding protein COQ10